MNESYEVQLQAAKERLNQSLGETAADVVVLSERFGKSIHAVAKDVTEDQPELFNAIKGRSDRMQKARSGSISEGSISGPSEAYKGAIRGAKSGIRHHPELAAELLADPAVREAVTEAVASDPTMTATVASKVEEKRPSHPIRSSAGTGGGILGAGNQIGLLDALDHAVLVIEDKLPEFTAALRSGDVGRGDDIANEWRNKLHLAVQLLDDAISASVR